MANWDSLNPHQKLSLGIFIVLGGAGVLLWPFLMNKQITLPFKQQGSVTFKSAEQVEKENSDKLRKLDTDADGLTDYDEQYLFRTSPYVTDTDSDGLSDGQEVAADSDPNCPRGKNCRQVSLSGGTDAGVNAPVLGGAATAAGSGGQASAPTPDEERINAAITARFGDPTKLTPEAIRIGLSKMSITDLRAFLGDLGIPPAALQQADDATLRRLVEDTLNEIAVQNAAASNQGQ